MVEKLLLPARFYKPDGKLKQMYFPDGTLKPIMGGADKPFKFGPLALTTTYTTNILNPPAQAAAGIPSGDIPAQNICLILTHIRVINKLNADTFRLYIGATGANAAGTEFAFDVSVPAKGEWNWYGRKKLKPTDFLVGGAATTLTLVIEGEGVMVVE